MTKERSNALIISDLQIPFEHPKALEFCVRLKKEFKIPDRNVFCVGDELDQNWAGLYKRDPNAFYTPESEIKQSIDRLKAWYDAFPKMMLATSNHGRRAAKFAFEAGIPSIMMRQYQDVIEAVDGWRWAHGWTSETTHKFHVEHGDKRGYGGAKPHIIATLKNGMSTALGHYHSKAVVEQVRTTMFERWALVAGCLINWQEYAFKYSHDDAELPKIGTPVVVDDGKRAMWIPLS